MISCVTKRVIRPVHPFTYLPSDNPKSKFRYNWKGNDTNPYSFGNLYLHLNDSIFPNTNGLVYFECVIDNYKNIKSIDIKYIKVHRKKDKKFFIATNDWTGENIITNKELYSAFLNEFSSFVYALPIYSNNDTAKSEMNITPCFINIK